MGGQQAKQLFSPSGKQRVGSNREFGIAIIDIAAPRLNKTTKAFNGARKGPPERRRASAKYTKIKIGNPTIPRQKIPPTPLF
jgi:hypothetical protein